MTKPAPQSPVTLRRMMQYGIIALPLAFVGLPLYMHAPAFYAKYYGVSLTSLAAMLLFLRLFDALQDPLIGWIGDRFAAQRKPIIFGGITALALGILMIFHPFGNMPLLWFGISVAVTTTAFSLLAINLNMLGGIWTQNTYEKTKITTTREVFALLGILIAAALPVFLEKITSPENALPVFAVLTALLTIICGLVFWRWLQQQRFVTETATPVSFSVFMTVLAEKNLRGFCLVYFISALAAAFPLVMFLFFVNDYLNAREWSGIFLGIYFLSGILAMPLWLFLSRYRNKVFAWGVAMLLSVTAFVWVTTLQSGDILCFAFICAASGLALGAGMAIPPSILSDIIDRNNSRHTATGQFSVLTFLAKLALALASAAGLFGIAAAGYDAARVHQFQNAADALLIYYGFIPCILQLAALAGLVLWYGKYGKNINDTQNLTNNSGNFIHDHHHIS